MNDKKIPNKQEKKKLSLPKWLLWGALGIAVLLIGSALAVNILYKTTIDEDSEATEVELTEEEQTQQALEEEEQREPYITWESMKIPTVYPEYSDGNVATPDPAFEWTEEGIPNFITVLNTSQNATQAYVNDAIQNGWQTEEPEEELGDEDSRWFLTLQEGNTTHSILLKWFGENYNYLNMTLTSTPIEEE